MGFLLEFLFHMKSYKAHNKINEQFIQETFILPFVVDYPEINSTNNKPLFLPEYSIMKLAIISLTLGAASAFAPPSASRASITSLSMSDAGVKG